MNPSQHRFLLGLLVAAFLAGGLGTWWLVFHWWYAWGALTGVASLAALGGIGWVAREMRGGRQMAS